MGMIHDVWLLNSKIFLQPTLGGLTKVLVDYLELGQSFYVYSG